MSTIQLKECGKVLISSDHRLVVCECFYCNAIHTEWQGFLEHVKTKHSKQDELQQLNEISSKIDECNKDVIKNETIEEAAVITPYEKKQTTELGLEKLDYFTSGHKETLSFDRLSDDHSDIYEEETSFEIEYVKFDDESIKSEENFELNYKTCNNELEEQVTIDKGFDIIEIEDCKDFDIIEKEKSVQDINERERFENSAPHYCTEEFFEVATESEILSFIDIIKKHPCLWSTKLKHTNRGDQDYMKSLRDIQDSLQISPKDTIATLNYLMIWFKSEYNRFKDCRNNKTSFISNHRKYFENCKFLISSSAENSPRILKRKSTTVSNDFKCSHCDKVFSKKKYLTLHIRRHIKDFSYKCDYCDKRTVNSTDMKTHMRVHTGEKPYVCEICGKSFKTCSVLNAHIRKHDVPKFQCDLCSKSYFNSTDLKNHTNAHLNKRDYKCQFCTKAFTSAKLVYSHIMNSHSTLRKTFCKICQKCFTNIGYHMKSAHEVVANS